MFSSNDVYVFILNDSYMRQLVTSAHSASSSVFGVTFQESSLVPERCFLDKLQCCYNCSLIHLSLYAGRQAI